MASKRRLRRRSCEGKRYHSDQTSAVRHLISLRDSSQMTYKCQFCNGWHVGRPNRRIRQFIQATQSNKRS